MSVPQQIPFVGVGVVVTRGDEWLLMRRMSAHGGGTWSTPGGHLDFGESPEDCARREVAEETGLTIDVVNFIGITNDVFDTDRHYVTLWFEAEAADGDLVIAAPDEVAELAWSSPRELPRPLFAPLQRLLEGNYLGSRVWRHS